MTKISPKLKSVIFSNTTSIYLNTWLLHWLIIPLKETPVIPDLIELNDESTLSTNISQLTLYWVLYF